MLLLAQQLVSSQKCFHIANAGGRSVFVIPLWGKSCPAHGLPAGHEAGLVILMSQAADNAKS